jgi:hypothetical protein
VTRLEVVGMATAMRIHGNEGYGTRAFAATRGNKKMRINGCAGD